MSLAAIHQQLHRLEDLGGNAELEAIELVLARTDPPGGRRGLDARPTTTSERREGQLAAAGASYALAVHQKALVHARTGSLDVKPSAPHARWPFSPLAWKPAGMRRMTVKGAALILAELARQVRGGLSSPDRPGPAPGPGPAPAAGPRRTGPAGPGPGPGPLRPPGTGAGAGSPAAGGAGTPGWRPARARGGPEGRSSSGKCRGLQGAGAAAQQGPLQGVQQLPEVAGPGQPGQGLGQPGLAAGGAGCAGLQGHPGHQARHQVREFVPPLAQGGQGEHRALQPVQQVLAERPGRRQGLQRAVGGGQEPHVHPAGPARRPPGAPPAPAGPAGTGDCRRGERSATSSRNRVPALGALRWPPCGPATRR